MFGDQLVLSDVIIITVIGMGIVFLILLLLTFVVSLFKYIPNNDIVISNKTVTQSTTPVLASSEESVSPLCKAIIIASILEYENVIDKKNYIRITNIRKI